MDSENRQVEPVEQEDPEHDSTLGVGCWIKLGVLLEQSNTENNIFGGSKLKQKNIYQQYLIMNHKQNQAIKVNISKTNTNWLGIPEYITKKHEIEFDLISLQHTEIKTH